MRKKQTATTTCLQQATYQAQSGFQPTTRIQLKTLMIKAPFLNLQMTRQESLTNCPRRMSLLKWQELIGKIIDSKYKTKTASKARPRLCSKESIYSPRQTPFNRHAKQKFLTLLRRLTYQTKLNTNLAKWTHLVNQIQRTISSVHTYKKSTNATAP